MVANLDRLAEQAAGIVAQVEDQALQVAEAVDGVVDFLAGGLLKLGEVNVADAGTNLIGQIDGGVGDLGAHQIEDQGLGLAGANHGGLDVGALGALERLGHLVGRGEAAGNLAVHGNRLAVDG